MASAAKRTREAESPEAPPLQVTMRPLASLIPYARNARTHSPEQVKQLAASIKEFGWTNPVLVDGENGIIAGHGRVQAAQLLGLAEVPCIELAYLSETQRRAYILADNKLALNAGWDAEMLSLELDDLKALDFDLDLTGFSLDEVADIAAEVIPPIEAKTDPDDVPEVPPAPITRLGDVWLLGKHRVMCGDSTNINAVETLMAGEKAALVVTDPPYGVSYADKNRSLNAFTPANRIQTPIENDHLKGNALSDFFLEAFSTMFAVMQDGCPFYVFAPQGGEQMLLMMMMLKQAGLPVRHELIWVKNNHVLGRADYHYKHEPVLYGWKNGAGHPWYGERNKFSVWEVSRPTQSKLHPTMKPVELMEIPLQNSAAPSTVVLDLFGGSGSTLIACEKTSRFARLMELSPAYCDVIVRRWQEFTGQKATLEGDGRTFDEVAAGAPRAEA